MENRISLNGDWQFKDADDADWNNGKVPGCVQLDLMALGKIDDPFYRMNEIAFHKIEEKDWVYKREFEFNESDFDEAHLVFEGIDTYAEIYLNGNYVADNENMFIPLDIDITNLLIDGKNTLEVKLNSPIKFAKAIEKNSPASLAWSTESARPYIRKAQYSYGWDWGPRLEQVGIWRDVYISVIKEVRITNPYFYTEKLTKNSAFVRISADLDSFVDEELIADIEISCEGEVCARKVVVVDSEIETSIVIDNPKIWYPNGIGEHPLYEIKIKVKRQSDILDEITFKSGIRTVNILRNKDKDGESFIFEINGAKVFVKGADWIPADSFLPRLTSKDYGDYIRLAKDANMNMLRIWGGGIYEDKAFYEACDEMGIMVWQDFMYACAQYPDKLEWFRDLTRVEAEDIVLSLRNHPSIVLWCGNNENNWGFHSWWNNGDPKYLGNYIYKEILPDVCSSLDPSRPYWVSSPYGGKDPNSEEEGDRHQWGVWSGWLDYGAYLNDNGRFLSEFGFQSMPDWKTVLSYTSPEDRTILSPVMLAHNKMSEGMERLIRFMVGRVGFPKDLKSFVYLTQFIQAEAIKTGVEHWRSRKFLTSGTLYWQLNDCWPVASWSCLDYYKRKKALYYYSAKFYNNILPVIKKEGNGITLYGISDLSYDAKADVRVKVFKLNGEKTYEKYISSAVIANDVTKMAHISTDDMGIGYSPRQMPTDIPGCTLPVEKNGELLDSVVYVEMTVEGKGITNYLLFDRIRNLSLACPQINYEIDQNTITLTTDVPAFGVFIETENDVDVSDNCLTMMPGERYSVICSADPGSITIHNVTSLVSKI